MIRRCAKWLGSVAVIMGLWSVAAVGQACTLYAAAGDVVGGGGTLLAKNRDWRPDHVQAFALHASQGGYRFAALEVTGGVNKGPKAGVNERGLSVVTASPPPYVKSLEEHRYLGAVRYILSHYGSVKEALAGLERQEWAMGSGFILLADSEEVANVAFALQGVHQVERTRNGVLSQTNHYQGEAFQGLNGQAELHSSRSRLAKIRALLIDAERAYTAEDFRAWGREPVLWRVGKTPTGTRTLAQWVIRLQPDGNGELWLRIANPDMEVEELHWDLRELFGKEKFEL